jgi:hypothetical protein
MKSRAMLLFLDFDGVLRRADSPRYRFDEDCLELFQETVRSLDSLEIVVSSSWKDGFTLNEIRARFAPDIAERILGVTQSLLRREEHPRHREVLAFLRRQGWEKRRWVAIDDDPDNYGPGANVVLTDPAKGFDRFAAESLARSAR